MEQGKAAGSNRRDLEDIKDEFRAAADETAKLAAQEYAVIKGHARQVIETAIDQTLEYVRKKPLEGLGMVFMSGVFVGLLVARGKSAGF